MDDFYVYLHIKLTDGEPFYVGRGRGNRAYERGRGRRSQYWFNIVDKYGFDVIFLENNLTGDFSFELEKYWIGRIGRMDLGLGPLVNFTDGGEGTCGMSKEAKEKRSKQMKGKNVWMKGRKLSDETRERMSKSRMGHKYNVGRKATQETKERQRKSMKGKNTGKRTEELKRKISESLKGKKQSEETKIKRGISLKKAWKLRKEKLKINEISNGE